MDTTRRRGARNLSITYSKRPCPSNFCAPEKHFAWTESTLQHENHRTTALAPFGGEGVPRSGTGEGVQSVFSKQNAWKICLACKSLGADR